jgi:hypothetical protein
MTGLQIVPSGGGGVGGGAVGPAHMVAPLYGAVPNGSTVAVPNGFPNGHTNGPSAVPSGGVNGPLGIADQVLGLGLGLGW